MKTIPRVIFALLLCAGPLLAGPDSSFDELDKEAETHKADQPWDPADLARKQREDLETLSAGMREQYDLYLKGMAEQREQLRQMVLKQWLEFQESTNKQWVDYSGRGDSRSKVDFEKGEIRVETLLPVEEAAPGKKKTSYGELGADEKKKVKALAEKKLGEQTKKIFAEKETKSAPILKDQVKTPDGKPVTEKNVDQFVEKTLAPRIEIDDKPVIAQDGKPRLKATVVIPLVPDHLKVRAKRQQARVEAAAKKYALDPALVFAIIHTESEFNPRARSQAPAFGLMQLMPKTAGLDAYKFLYKEEKLLSPDYLYDPDNNILLGATYLHLLESRHYAKIKDPANRRTLTIAAYNCGPGCVRKSVLASRDANSMSNAELVALIRQAAPKETQEYVPHVQGRIELYREL